MAQAIVKAIEQLPTLFTLHYVTIRNQMRQMAFEEFSLEGAIELGKKYCSTQHDKKFKHVCKLEVFPMKQAVEKYEEGINS